MLVLTSGRERSTADTARRLVRSAACSRLDAVSRRAASRAACRLVASELVGNGTGGPHASCTRPHRSLLAALQPWMCG